jgi:mannose-1-phosphate guanylyltransferase
MKEQTNRSIFKDAAAISYSAVAGLDNRRAVVLAGAGELSEDRLLSAELRRQRPSHFCRDPGGEFLINRTRKQIERIFSPDDVMFVVTKGHRRYYEEVLDEVPPENLIVQPQDDGSTTAILYAALRMAVTDPSAVLVFFPAELKAASDAEFMERVDAACRFVHRDPNVVLLGESPTGEEPNADLILPERSVPVDENLNVFTVKRFIANAPFEQTRGLTGRGALVGTSVMVGTAPAVLRLIRRAAPEIYENFSLAAERIGTPGEQRAVQAAYYSQAGYTDFSRDVLEKCAEKLLVVPVPASLRSAARVEPPKLERPAEQVRLPHFSARTVRMNV